MAWPIVQCEAKVFVWVAVALLSFFAFLASQHSVRHRRCFASMLFPLPGARIKWQNPTLAAM